VETLLDLSQGAPLQYHHADTGVFDVPPTHSWKKYSLKEKVLQVVKASVNSDDDPYLIQ